MEKPEIVIFDTEYTAWEDSKERNWGAPGYHREVVQIAARRWVLGTDWRKAKTFCEFIRPVINPTLDPYFTKLTGIKQSQVARAKSAKVVFAKFAKFAGGNPCFSNGNDVNPIAETAGLQRFVLPLDPECLINFRPWLHTALEIVRGPFEKKKFPSGALYRLLKIKLPTDAVHNAMHDVNSICATIEGLAAQGVEIDGLWK